MDMKNSAVSMLFRKISADRRSTDAAITRGKLLDSPKSSEPEFMQLPLIVQAMNSLFGFESITDNYSAARESAKMFFGDPAAFGAIIKNVSKATAPNKEKRPFEINTDAIGADADLVYDTLHNVFQQRGMMIYKRSKNFARDMLMEGQAFYRLTVDGDLLATMKKVKGPRSGFEILGPIDDKDGKPWFIQREKASKKIVNVFYEWEIVPFYWNFDEETGTGMPLAMAAGQPYGRQKTGSDALKVARLTRAFPKKVFKYDPELKREKFLQAVAAYKEQRGDMSIEDDAFSDEHTQANIDILDLSSPSLYQIDDIKYHETDKMRALGLARPFYDGEGAPYPNRAVLDILYDEWVSNMIGAIEEAVTGEYEASGILKVVNLQLALMGRTHWASPVTLEWPYKGRVTKEQSDALDSSFDRAELSPQTYLMLKHNVDAEAELERIAKWRELRQEVLGDDDSSSELARMKKARQQSEEPANPSEADENEVDTAAETVSKFSKNGAFSYGD